MGTPLRKIKAVLMAGGFGTRIQPLTNSIPKPMLPIVNIPMMEHILNKLRESGIDEIVIIDPGPGTESHVDVLCGCGGDRIRWIVMTDTDAAYAGAALKLKQCTGAKLVAPAGFDGADIELTDGYQFDATEFRITAMSVGGDGYVMVLEQERTLIPGDHLDDGVPEGLTPRLKRYRMRSIAPGHGQYIEDARSILSR